MLISNEPYKVPESIEEASDRRRALLGKLDSMPVVGVPIEKLRAQKAVIRDEIRFLKNWMQAQFSKSFTRIKELEAENEKLRAEVESLKAEVARRS